MFALRHLRTWLSLVLIILLMSACSSSDSTEATDATPVIPAVSTFYPAKGATDVALNTSLAAAFNKPMAAATITSTSCVLSANNTTTAASVSYNDSSNLVVITPNQSLAPATTYTVTLASSITDSDGSHTLATTSWSFTTGSGSDTTGPVISSITPADTSSGQPLTLPVSVVFDEQIDPASLVSSLTLNTGGTAIPGTVSYDLAARRATFTPSSPLSYNTTYTATVSSGARDMAGNQLQTGATWTFSTTSNQHFLYVGGGTPGGTLFHISSYAINSTDGSLSPIETLPLITDIYSITISPANASGRRFLYVTHNQADSVSAYEINSATGALTMVPGSPFSVGDNPHSLVTNATGTVAYVANSDANTVTSYGISADGALTYSSAIATGYYYPFTLSLSTTGERLYATNHNSGYLSSLKISDLATGTFDSTLTASVVTKTLPLATYLSPLGTYLYVTNFGSASISVYNTAYLNDTSTTTDPDLGTYSTKSGPISLAADPSGKFLYTANHSSDNLSGYRINQDTGSLVHLSSGPFLTGTSIKTGDGSGPSAIAIDPSGQFLYSVNMYSNTISRFFINATTGTLTLQGTPTSAGIERPLALSVF